MLQAILASFLSPEQVQEMFTRFQTFVKDYDEIKDRLVKIETLLQAISEKIENGK